VDHPGVGCSPDEFVAIMEKVVRYNGINLRQNRNRWYSTGAD
jgi:hypothetical protein